MKQIMAAMTITDYLINAVFVLIVFRQARERELDRRSVIIPLAIVAYVAHLYVHSIPTAGNDLVLIAALGTVGLTLGIASGFATHVRAGENGLAVARVGWIAGALLIAGIGSRMVFAFALSPRRAPRGRQLQHRPPDRRRRLASGAGVDGAARGQHPDRDRPAPRPPRDAVQRRDRRRGMTSDRPTSPLSGPPAAGRIAFYRPHRGDRIRASAQGRTASG